MIRHIPSPTGAHHHVMKDAAGGMLAIGGGTDRNTSLRARQTAGAERGAIRAAGQPLFGQVR